MFDQLETPVEVVSELAHPIALNLTGAKRYILLCDVVFRYGAHELRCKQDYEFDGPSIPRVFWWIVGLSPADVEMVLPSLPHDWICDTRELPRIVGDALYCVMMGPILFNGRPLPGIGPKRKKAAYLSVRSYSVLSGKG